MAHAQHTHARNTRNTHATRTEHNTGMETRTLGDALGDVELLAHGHVDVAIADDGAQITARHELGDDGQVAALRAHPHQQQNARMPQGPVQRHTHDTHTTHTHDTHDTHDTHTIHTHTTHTTRRDTHRGQLWMIVGKTRREGWVRVPHDLGFALKGLELLAVEVLVSQQLDRHRRAPTASLCVCASCACECEKSTMTSAMAGDNDLVDDAVVAACDDVVAAELELLRPDARTAQSLVATDNKKNRQK